MKEILIQYQTLIAGLIGLIGGYILRFVEQKFYKKYEKYERRINIFKNLISLQGNVVSDEFCNAFNSILVEFSGDKDVLDKRDKFLEVAYNKPAEDFNNVDTVNLINSLIELIDVIRKRLKINMEQFDITKVYTPMGLQNLRADKYYLIDIHKKLNSLLDKLNTEENIGILNQTVNNLKK
ncbi:MAG: hypothetical protein LBL71_00590 [Endomicrobium sp.]|nr:hypothetical protein [Endomicrobium sp.]